MTRYRLCATIDTANLTEVIEAVTEAAVQGLFDPEIGLSPMREPLPFTEPPAPPAPTLGEVAHELHPPKKVRAKKDGGVWPAEGSIYGVVLERLRTSTGTKADLRAALERHNFKPGSLSSALARLEKANKVVRAADGVWALPNT